MDDATLASHLQEIADHCARQNRLGWPELDFFAADVGLQYPAGKVELVMGVTIGATRYGQDSKAVGTRSASASTARVATEFLVAPNFSVQIRTLTAAVGIAAGIYPARRAASLSSGMRAPRWPAQNR